MADRPHRLIAISQRAFVIIYAKRTTSMGIVFSHSNSELAFTAVSRYIEQHPKPISDI
jgi:hypothetical protein